MDDWRKSTYSDANGGNCVEVGTGDAVLIRDTTDRDGFTLSVPPAAWTTFLAQLLRPLLTPGRTSSVAGGQSQFGVMPWLMTCWTHALNCWAGDGRVAACRTPVVPAMATARSTARAMMRSPRMLWRVGGGGG